MKNEPTVRAAVRKSRRLTRRFRNSLRRTGKTTEQQTQPEVEQIDQSYQPTIELIKQQDHDGFEIKNKKKSRENVLLRVLSNDSEPMPIEQRAIILLQQSTFSEIFHIMKKYLIQNPCALKKEQFAKNAFACVGAMIEQGYTKEVMKIFQGAHKPYNNLLSVIQKSFSEESQKEYGQLMDSVGNKVKQMHECEVQLQTSNIVEISEPKKKTSFFENFKSPRVKRTASKKNGQLDEPSDLDHFIHLKEFLNTNPKRSKIEQLAEFVSEDLLKINKLIITQADVSLIKSENGLTTSALSLFSELFNQLTNMLAQQILSEYTKEKMMSWVIFYILVAKKSIEKMDYSTAFAINNGLNQGVVDRLKLFEHLPLKIKNIKADLDELLTPIGNFKNLRMLEGAMLPSAVIAKDITSAQEIELYHENDAFNLQRDIVCSKVLLPMMRERYDILSNPENVGKLLERRTDITHILKTTQILDNDTLFNLSLQRKPSGLRTLSAPGPFGTECSVEEVAPPLYQSAPARIEDSDIIQKKSEERSSLDSKIFDFSTLRMALSSPELGAKECIFVEGPKSHRERVKTLVLFFEEQSKSEKSFHILGKDEFSDTDKDKRKSLK